jgi:phosphomannomutase/phosphoglucomutase
MVDSLNAYASTPEIRIETTEEKKWEIVANAREWFGERYETIDIDGVRVDLPGGWALLRASNTQPVVVARAEGRRDEELGGILAILDGFLERHGVTGVEWR